MNTPIIDILLKAGVSHKDARIAVNVVQQTRINETTDKQKPQNSHTKRVKRIVENN